MPHIHTEPGQHDHTASAFIIRTDTPEPVILFHMHKKLHKLLQPGGHVELNETPWQAVLHEVREETGYELSQLDILQPPLRLKLTSESINHPMPIGHNTHLFKVGMDHFHTDIAYAFVSQQAPLGLPSEQESSDLRWLTASQLRALDASEVGESSREIALFALEKILDIWEVVSLDEFTA